jgi:hypothetical protein
LSLPEVVLIETATMRAHNKKQNLATFVKGLIKAVQMGLLNVLETIEIRTKLKT